MVQIQLWMAQLVCLFTSVGPMPLNKSREAHLLKREGERKIEVSKRPSA